MSTDPKPGAADILFQLAASKQERIEALSEENAELRARAERAEAQLEEAYGALRTANRYTNRVRPVVAAAEALVEACKGVGRISMWDPHLDLLNPLRVLIEKVKEAQR